MSFCKFYQPNIPQYICKPVHYNKLKSYVAIMKSTTSKELRKWNIHFRFIVASAAATIPPIKIRPLPIIAAPKRPSENIFLIYFLAL